MSNSNDYHLNHGKVVHATNSRIRIISSLFLKDPERAHVLEILLQMRNGIKKTVAVADIGSLVIEFDPHKLPKAALLKLLDALLANLGHRKATMQSFKSSEIIPTEAYEGIVEQKFTIAIDGMKCRSCALLIEMLLNRDSRISSAKVNYASKTANVKGNLSKESLCSLIENMGYKAHNLDSFAKACKKNCFPITLRIAALVSGLVLPIIFIRWINK